MNMKHNSLNTRFENKWSKLIATNGFTEIPNLLIENQAKLSISSSQMVVLLGLLKHKWTDSEPYPSVNTLAMYSGMKHQTIRTHLRNLENKKLIYRNLRIGKTTAYDLLPLKQRLEACAQHQIDSAQKQIDPISNIKGVPYSKTNTKEYTYKKENRKLENGKIEKVMTIY